MADTNFKDGKLNDGLSSHKKAYDKKRLFQNPVKYLR